jgi:periplasmic protein TonB
MRSPTCYRLLLVTGSLALAFGLAACTALPGSSTPSPSATKADEVPSAPPDSTISFQTPAIKAYRKTGAGHIYKKYPSRIYPTKIPPLVYAVVVVETHVEADGRVKRVSFSRTPSHAPEVPPMIAQLITDASPLPAPPASVGAHTYVETWLWDRGGKFQLDTLTKGQRSR